MYDGRFVDAEDYSGKRYRDPMTGNLVNYCTHLYKFYPIYITKETHYAGIIKETSRRLDCLEGICCECGEVIVVPRNAIYASRDDVEEVLLERLEMGERERAKRTKEKEDA